MVVPCAFTTEAQPSRTSKTVNPANRVLILSGGLTTGESPDEGLFADTAFFVSGSTKSRGKPVLGTALFGGDLVVSGGLDCGRRFLVTRGIGKDERSSH